MINKKDLFNEYISFVDDIVDKRFYNIINKDCFKQYGYIALYRIIRSIEYKDKKSFEGYLNQYLFLNILNSAIDEIEYFENYEDKVTLSVMAILRLMKKNNTNNVPSIDDLSTFYLISRRKSLYILWCAYIHFDDINIPVDKARKEVNTDIELDIINKIETEALVKEILNNLKKEEWKLILIKQFGLFNSECNSFEEIGKYFDVTRQCVNEKSLKAIKRLKKLNENTLQNYN